MLAIFLFIFNLLRYHVVRKLANGPFAKWFVVCESSWLVTMFSLDK